MKRFGWLMAMALVALLTGCGQGTGTGQKAAVSGSKSTVTGKQVVRISQNAAEMLQGYVQQVRDDYLKTVEAQFERVVQRAGRLQTKADKAGAELQGKVNAELKVFNAKKDAARLQLEKAKAAPDQPLEPFKASLDEAMNDLEQELDQLMNIL